MTILHANQQLVIFADSRDVLLRNDVLSRSVAKRVVTAALCQLHGTDLLARLGRRSGAPGGPDARRPMLAELASLAPARFAEMTNVLNLSSGR